MGIFNGVPPPLSITVPGVVEAKRLVAASYVLVEARCDFPKSNWGISQMKYLYVPNFLSLILIIRAVSESGFHLSSILLVLH